MNDKQRAILLDAYIRKLEDERIAAYELALTMIGDLTIDHLKPAVKLHALLDLLECRDLMRERRRDDR